MNKKMKSTYDERIEKMTPKERKRFDEGLRDFALSELILALMEKDEISVRRLAKIANISPTVVRKFTLEFKNQSIPLDISRSMKK